jgi:uncharacterized protein
MAENVALVQDAYDGFAKGDVEPLVSILHENSEWHEAEHGTYWPGGSFRGPQAVLEGVLGRIPQDFDDFQIEIKRILESGDTVFVEARYRATAKATGKLLSAQVAHVWDFQDGKVVHWQQYTDTWQFAQVTGIAPQT